MNLAQLTVGTKVLLASGDRAELVAMHADAESVLVRYLDALDEPELVAFQNSSPKQTLSRTVLRRRWGGNNNRAGLPPCLLRFCPIADAIVHLLRQLLPVDQSCPSPSCGDMLALCGHRAFAHVLYRRVNPPKLRSGLPSVSGSTMRRTKIVLKRANGHSYFAVEQAIRLIASGKYPLPELCTHSYGLADVSLAIRTVAGDGVPGGIHVSVLPWSGQ